MATWIDIRHLFGLHVSCFSGYSIVWVNLWGVGDTSMVGDGDCHQGVILAQTGDMQIVVFFMHISEEFPMIGAHHDG